LADPLTPKGRSKLPFVAAGLGIVLILAVAYGVTHASSLSFGPSAQGPFASSQTTPAPGNPSVQLNGNGAAAPDFQGIVDWENSQPLKLSDLRGKVVLVDFWTYSCINCQNTFPYLRKWYQAYKDQGLVIVGVHSPEFDFEKNVSNIRQAIKHYDVQWPVAVDSSMTTWNAYQNQYWPAEYLIDKDGNVRNVHFGEGEYDKSEGAIRALLAEAGHNVGPAGADAGRTPQGTTTQELYAAAGRGFDIPGEHAGQAFDYKEPGADPSGHRKNNFIYFNGLWNIGSEFAEHARASDAGQDYVVIDYQAREAVMVAANGAAPVQAFVTMDGKDIPQAVAGADIKYDASGHSYVQVDRSDLYSLVKTQVFEEHTLQVSPTGAGFRLFTFDFNG
jgi:thiol-disulfide isomerase/thioredoxin